MYELVKNNDLVNKLNSLLYWCKWLSLELKGRSCLYKTVEPKRSVDIGREATIAAVSFTFVTCSISSVRGSTREPPLHGSTFGRFLGSSRTMSKCMQCSCRSFAKRAAGGAIAASSCKITAGQNILWDGESETVLIDALSI